MSQSAAARTARLDPSLIAITSSRPRSISTTVWLTWPPSNTRDAPWVRLVRPEVTAASWSTRSGGKPCENAIGSPSDDTTMACATDGTRSTKFVTSQLRSCAGRVSGLTSDPSFPDGQVARFSFPRHRNAAHLRDLRHDARLLAADTVTRTTPAQVAAPLMIVD